MPNGGGAYRHCGMYSPPPPMGTSSAGSKDMATLVVDTAAETAVMMTCPSVVVLVVLHMEDLACYDGIDRLVVLGVDLEWVCATEVVRLVVREVLEDSISTTRAQFPLRPILYRLPTLAVATVRSEMVQVENPVVPVRLRETPRALEGSLGCSPLALVEVRAVLVARLPLLLRLVVLERVRRGIREQLGDEIELV